LQVVTLPYVVLGGVNCLDRPAKLIVAGHRASNRRWFSWWTRDFHGVRQFLSVESDNAPIVSVCARDATCHRADGGQITFHVCGDASIAMFRCSAAKNK
jgi:hypothetical protein